MRCEGRCPDFFHERIAERTGSIVWQTHQDEDVESSLEDWSLFFEMPAAQLPPASHTGRPQRLRKLDEHAVGAGFFRVFRS